MDNINYMLESINEVYNEEMNSRINYENCIEDMQLQQLFESYYYDIINETVSEEKLQKIREKAGKRISRAISNSNIDYDDLKLQILTNRSDIVKYIGKITASGATGGAVSTAYGVGVTAASGLGKQAVKGALAGGALGTLIGSVIVFGGYAIYALIQNKRYDQLCVINLIGTKTNKKGLKKQRVIQCWLTIKISKNDLDPKVKSKVKFI